MNFVVMKYSGDKPEVNEEVMITSTGTVGKSSGKNMSHVIGYRIYDYGNLDDDEIKVCLIGGIIDNRYKNEALEFIERENQARRTTKEPLFTSKIDARGRLTIRSDVRQRRGIKPGDSVDVFEIEKVINDESHK